MIRIYHHRAAESVAAQQSFCELSKGLVSRARMLYANSESNREPERARASKREPERGWPHILSMPQHCFVAKQLNTTLFCRKTLKYGTFCRKMLKYGTFCREMLKYALWAEENGINCCELTPHFNQPCTSSPKKGQLQIPQSQKSSPKRNISAF